MRLTEPEAELAASLDGTRTLTELTVAGLAHEGMDPDLVGDFVRFLHRGGFLTQSWIDTYAVLAARTAPLRTRVVDRVWRQLRTMTIEFPGADRFIDRIYDAAGRWAFAAPAQVIMMAVLVSGLIAFGAQSEAGKFDLLGEPSTGAAVTLFVLGLGALFFHELGHALAIRHAGRRILGAGFQLYLAHPAFFIDSSDMVMAPPRARAMNAAAGPYSQAVVASTAALVAALAGTGEVGELLFRFAGVTYVFTLINLVPFLELDGYWLMTDVLDVPDLRPRALRFLRHELGPRIRERTRLSAREYGLVLFGVLGALFTVVALVTAWIFWWPIARGFGGGLWRLGSAGQLLLVLLAAVVVGPLIHGLGDLGRAAAHWAESEIDAVRFRLERRWRVEAAELIAALPLATNLTVEVLGDLAGRLRRRRYSGSETVVRHGDAADAFFVVRTGQFAVVERTRQGGEAVIAVLGPGATFGELALLEGTPRTATVRADPAGEALSIDAGTFQRLLAGKLAPPALAPAEWPITEVWTLKPFRRLDVTAATHLATSGKWVHARPGEEIVREGEAGDTFYVVASGQLETDVGGTVVTMLRRGDFFGELALLHDAPRRATVRAITPVRLFELDRAAFDAILRSAFRSGHVTARHAGPDALGAAGIAPVNCWHCRQIAVGSCRFCGRAVCADHAETRPYPIAVYRGGPEQTPRMLVVDDALHCGACTPRENPVELPELDA